MGREFKTTLLREKFVLQDPAASEEPIVALSNRMVLALENDEGGDTETYVIRTQNMHSCTRLCAAIAKEYFDRGAMMNRMTTFQWAPLWRDVSKGYEKDWNPDAWAAIYYKGRVIFEDGTRHPLLDIIEKCDSVTHQEYEKSVEFAEQAFQTAGKAMKIEHDANVALIVTVTDTEARCGLILRVANKKQTFNFTATQNRMRKEKIRVPTLLTVSAAFLEGIQLAFGVGMANRKKDLGLIVKYSDDDRKARRGVERLTNLNNAIEQVELKYNFHYRPERPDFTKIVKEATEYAERVIKPAGD